MPLWRALEAGKRYVLARWHRRAGKDEVALHWTACAVHQRVGTYWHMLPEASQARKAIWEAVNPHTGIRRVDEAFPKELRATTREQEMFIRFKCGSTWQVVGSDNFNSLVGSPPIGIVLSEWALAKPAAWAYLRPILAENGGWALFISTPRGRNHMQKMEEAALQDPKWFVQSLPATETDVFTPETLTSELKSYIGEYGADDGESLFRQEFLVSYDAAIIGSYYTKQIEDAERSGRVRTVDIDPALPVHSAWDLGISDSTAIWCFQVAGREIRVVDYHEAHGKALDYYADWLSERGYKGTDYVPHDAKVRELGTGRTRVETLVSLGRKPRVVPDHKLMDGINAARQTLDRCWFDSERCADGIEALRNYRREWDQDKKVFKDAPRHDWASHPADAFRYMAMGYRELSDEGPKPPTSPKLIQHATYADMMPKLGGSKGRSRI